MGDYIRGLTKSEMGKIINYDEINNVIIAIPVRYENNVPVLFVYCMAFEEDLIWDFYKAEHIYDEEKRGVFLYLIQEEALDIEVKYKKIYVLDFKIFYIWELI